MKKIVKFLTLSCCIAVLGIATSCSKEDDGQDNGTNNSIISEFSYPGNFGELYSYANKSMGCDSATIVTYFLEQGFTFEVDDKEGDLLFKKNLESGERIKISLSRLNNVVESAVVRSNISFSQDGSNYILEEYKDDVITHLKDIKSFAQKHNLSNNRGFHLEGNEYGSIEEMIDAIPETQIRESGVSYSDAKLYASLVFLYKGMGNEIELSR